MGFIRYFPASFKIFRGNQMMASVAIKMLLILVAVTSCINLNPAQTPFLITIWRTQAQKALKFHNAFYLCFYRKFLYALFSTCPCNFILTYIGGRVVLRDMVFWFCDSGQVCTYGKLLNVDGPYIRLGRGDSTSSIVLSYLCLHICHDDGSNVVDASCRDPSCVHALEGTLFRSQWPLLEFPC